MIRSIMPALLVAALLTVGGCYSVRVGNGGDSSRTYTNSPLPPPAPAAPSAPAAPTYPDSPPPPPPPPVTPAVVDPPPPAQPAARSGRGWADVVRKIAGEVFLDTEGGAVFYAYDTLAHPNKPIELVARLRSAKDLSPVVGATVAFRRGEWVAGRITTDANGVAALRWTPPKAGDYSFQAEVVAAANESQREMLGLKAPLLVASRDKRRPRSSSTSTTPSSTATSCSSWSAAESPWPGPSRRSTASVSDTP